MEIILIAPKTQTLLLQPGCWSQYSKCWPKHSWDTKSLNNSTTVISGTEAEGHSAQATWTKRRILASLEPSEDGHDGVEARNKLRDDNKHRKQFLGYSGEKKLYSDTRKKQTSEEEKRTTWTKTESNKLSSDHSTASDRLVAYSIRYRLSRRPVLELKANKVNKTPIKGWSRLRASFTFTLSYLATQKLLIAALGCPNSSVIVE